MIPPNAWFSTPAVDSKLFFQNVENKKSLFGCENYHYARAPWTAIILFCIFPLCLKQMGIEVLHTF